MKGCKDCSEINSTSYTRCNPPISSNCTFYQGTTLECSSDSDFTICKGTNFTDLQEQIFNKICQLSGSLDVNSVVIPNCPFLQDAWDDNDFTILNLFNMSLQLECDLKAQIDSLDAKLDTNNPIITGLNFCCCSVDCNTDTAEIRLSDALKQIIECVCTAKAIADAANINANRAFDQGVVTFNAIFDPVNGLNKQIADLTTFKTETLVRLACIETRIDNYGIPNC